MIIEILLRIPKCQKSLGINFGKLIKN